MHPARRAGGARSATTGRSCRRWSCSTPRSHLCGRPTQGIDFADLADLATKVEVVEAINNDLDKVMSEFNNAERVKKVYILGEEWLPDSDV